MKSEILAQGHPTEYSSIGMDILFEQMKDIKTHPDGRTSLVDLYRRHYELETKYGFKKEVIYTIQIDARSKHIAVPVFCYISPHPEGTDSLTLMTGIHGEEPGPPNAVANQIDEIGRLGQKMTLTIMPLLNPAGYYRNWRFHDMPFSLKRRNVTDSRHLLPDSSDPSKSMLAYPQSKISDRFTRYFLDLNRRYPIRLFFDLHEDAKLIEGYLYSQGQLVEHDPVAIECAQILVDNGVKLKMDGETRFPGEVVRNGLVFDQNGGPVQDGSIDQLAAAHFVFKKGLLVPNHAAHTAIVPETPTIGGITFDERVRAHETIIKNLPHFWDLMGLN